MGIIATITPKVNSSIIVAKKIVSTNSLCKNCPYSELFSSVFSHTRTEYGEIWSISLYLVQIQKNADQNNSEYGHFLRRDSLLHIGRIKTKFTEQRIGHSSIKYQNLKHLFWEDDNTISLFWSCIWLLKLRPLWNGFMRMVNTG